MQEGHVVEFISGFEEILVILAVFANVDDYDALGLEVFDLLS